MPRPLFVILFVLVTGLVTQAAAHPFTIDSVPAKLSNAPAGTTQVIVFYSEALEEEFSTLKVWDGNGNQVDNRDTSYYQDQESLVVTTEPLEEGIYTVTSKVLSKVDGHLVPDAFVFGVGDVTIQGVSDTPVELIYYPEAASRFPGLVGQTMILGAAIASVAIWYAHKIQCGPAESKAVSRIFHSRFLWITGIGIIAVLASNVTMLIIHSIRLEAGLAESLQTTFGGMWVVRMGITVAVLISWIILDRKRGARRAYVPMLISSLILAYTTTAIGHGAASGQMAAIILDYVHNLVAAAWIGGVIFFAFVIIPALSAASTRERDTLAIVPRFSMMITMLVGIVIITGPMLMWILEDDTDRIVGSTYGMLIIVKILIASIMVGMGAYHQILQRRAEKRPGYAISARLGRMLKSESILGIILLGTVALLVNGTLPAGQMQSTDAGASVYGLEGTYWTDAAAFHVDIFPFAPGSNDIMVKVTDSSGMQLEDLLAVKVKVSNPQKSITPIPVELEEAGAGEYAGQITFGFSDTWSLEIEAQRDQNANEAVLLNLQVKPRLQDLQMRVTEYEMPVHSEPLMPLHDGNGSIWMSDMANPVLWRFWPESRVFESFGFDGNATQALDIDGDGNVWFTDIAQESIGYLDVQTETIQIIRLPDIPPEDMSTVPISIEAVKDGIWVTIITKGVILRYDVETQEFEQFALHQQSAPFEVLADNADNIWYSESATGKIGRIVADTGEIVPVETDFVIAGPEAFIFDDTGSLWITEHSVAGIVKYDVLLDTFERISIHTPGSLPFGMSLDKYGNIWFAQHQIDMLGVLDPDSGEIVDVPIPTEASFVQHLTSDPDGNIWFAQARGGKIGMVNIVEDPSAVPAQRPDASVSVQYADVAAPLMAAGIVGSSLFFVKSVRDKRRICDMSGQDP